MGLGEGGRRAGTNRRKKDVAEAASIVFVYEQRRTLAWRRDDTPRLPGGQRRIGLGGGPGRIPGAVPARREARGDTCIVVALAGRFLSIDRRFGDRWWFSRGRGAGGCQRRKAHQHEQGGGGRRADALPNEWVIVSGRAPVQDLHATWSRRGFQIRALSEVHADATKL